MGFFLLATTMRVSYRLRGVFHSIQHYAINCLSSTVLGIEFLNHTQPGVRLSMTSELAAKMAGVSKAAVKARRGKTANAIKKKR
jgi:hypothetical protein